MLPISASGQCQTRPDLPDGYPIRLTVAGECVLQRSDAEACIHRVRQAPGQDLAGCPVHDSHQIQEARAHRDVGHVGTPEVIGPLDHPLRKTCLSSRRWPDVSKPRSSCGEHHVAASSASVRSPRIASKRYLGLEIRAVAPPCRLHSRTNPSRSGLA